jgi:hypothetical protein
MTAEGCRAGTPYCQDFPWVNLFGVTWLEPTTILTNLLITAICFFGVVQLRKTHFSHSVYQFFNLFLILMGCATAVAGILGHGLYYLYNMNSKVPGWYLSMIAVAFFERAAIMHAKPLLPAKVGNFFAIFNIIELFSFMIITLATKKFLFVEIHAFYGLFIVVFALELFVYLKKKDKGSQFIFLGTLLAALSALLHALRIGINQWFNHNDISHVGMAVAVWFYSKGVKNFEIYDAVTKKNS